MKFRLYPNSVLAWDAMYARIQQAKISIHIEMYIFTDDTATSHDFISLLKQKAQAGLQVILILDVFGSLALPNAVVKEMRDTGIEVRFFRHLIHRTHKKIVLIDGRIAFLGGVNITDHARKWNDLQVELSGRIVLPIYRSFKRTYKLTGGKLNPHKPHGNANWQKQVNVWLLENMPVIGRRMVKQYYLQKLNNATKTIVFVSPYFIPSRWMLGAMRNALSRGVNISVIIPSNTDFKLADNINRYYAGVATNMGVYVYFTSGMNHAKVALIDSLEGLVGSINIDALSFDIDNEIGVFFKDKHFITQLEEVIANWMVNAVPYNKERHKLKWYQILLIPLIRLFNPIL